MAMSLRKRAKRVLLFLVAMSTLGLLVYFLLPRGAAL